MPKSRSTGKSSNHEVVHSRGALSTKAKKEIEYMKKMYFEDHCKDEHSCEKIMQASFYDRREFILYRGPKVDEILDKYPILNIVKHFLAEFCRITMTNVVDNFHKNLKTYSLTILHFTPDIDPIKKLAFRTQESASNEEEKDYIERAAALLLLPKLLEESIKSISKFESKGTNTVYPVIVCESSVESVLLEKPTFYLFVEENKVFQTKDFTEAVLLRMAAHYCFDIQYQEEFCHSTTLIEMLLLGIDPDCNPVPEYVNERVLMLQLMHGHLLKLNS